jgi:iron(III) transport system ATP-binding protein
MRVSQNVAYPLKVAKVPRAEIRPRTSEVLARVGLAGKEMRYPRELSGGEQQRVALARAIVASPDVLLLDEPLSNLDAKLRQETLVWLVSLLRELNITTVYVTHDQTEALAISDRIAVMRAGEVVQHGRPTEIYEQPASTFVAQFVGAANLVEGRAVSCSVEEADVQPVAGGRVYSARIAARHRGLSAGDAVHLAVKPEAIRAHTVEPPGGGIRATVELQVYYGNGWEYLMRVKDKEIRMRSTAAILLEPGKDVWLTFEESALTVLWDEASNKEQEAEVQR